jgi:hypothetical protein
MKTENEQVGQTSPEGASQSGEPRKMSRREALAIVGKHAVYTAPAVLAVLAATKSNKAYADASFAPDRGRNGGR